MRKNYILWLFLAVLVVAVVLLVDFNSADNDSADTILDEQSQAVEGGLNDEEVELDSLIEEDLEDDLRDSL